MNSKQDWKNFLNINHKIECGVFYSALKKGYKWSHQLCYKNLQFIYFIFQFTYFRYLLFLHDYLLIFCIFIKNLYSLKKREKYSQGHILFGVFLLHDPHFVTRVLFHNTIETQLQCCSVGKVVSYSQFKNSCIFQFIFQFSLKT